jgi:hypothetical protein
VTHHKTSEAMPRITQPQDGVLKLKEK